MAKKKPTPTCNLDGCKKNRKRCGNSWGRFCSSHNRKATISLFLGSLYSYMDKRVKGKNKGSNAERTRHLYLGLPILPRDVFINWGKNHPDFLSIYKRWVTSNFDRKLTPSVNRMNSSKGYTLDNMEWMTNSQNCGLSAGVRSMKQKKAIYELLGVKQ